MIDFDGHWKRVITHLFEEFVDFFLPDLYPEVDFSKGVEFLEQEFHDIMAEKYKESKITDKVARLYLKNGNEKWILVHIEIQGQFETNFSERMFLYGCHLMVKFGMVDLAALAIFTSKSVPKKHNQYLYKNRFVRWQYDYQSYKVWKQKVTQLEASPNPFALVVLAALYALKADNDKMKVYRFKRKLIRLAYEKGLSKLLIHYIFTFMHGIMRTDKALEMQLYQETINIHQKYYPMYAEESVKQIYDDFARYLLGETIDEMKARWEAEAETKLEHKLEELKAEAEAEIQVLEAKAEAERKEIEAKAEAERKEIEAKAEAERKEIEAKAEAERKEALEAVELKTKYDTIRKAYLSGAIPKEQLTIIFDLTEDELKNILG